ncbi:hypothetical protein RJT34_02126 [Clitoria ternatea]|uniref:chorismate mutase n=1 Tax=Clitoria ternatea TaxID=43366 RepID=A0AAN9Q073_CLITE
MERDQGGDDGNYAQTAASDLSLLQAISRRIHYGKFVAEVKFRDSPQDYEPLICAKAISRRIHYGKFVAEVKFRDSPQHYEPLIRAKLYIYMSPGYSNKLLSGAIAYIEPAGRALWNCKSLCLYNSLNSKKSLKGMVAFDKKFLFGLNENSTEEPV